VPGPDGQLIFRAQVAREGVWFVPYRRRPRSGSRSMGGGTSIPWCANASRPARPRPFQGTGPGNIWSYQRI